MKVVINNKDLDIMIKMENVIMKYGEKIFGKNHNKKVKMIFNWTGEEEVYYISWEDYMKYNNLIEKIIQEKIKRNKRQSEITRQKRKENKMYARSRKEKEAHEKAINKRLEKENN